MVFSAHCNLADLYRFFRFQMYVIFSGTIFTDFINQMTWPVFYYSASYVKCAHFNCSLLLQLDPKLSTSLFWSLLHLSTMRDTRKALNVGLLHEWVIWMVHSITGSVLFLDVWHTCFRCYFSTALWAHYQPTALYFVGLFKLQNTDLFLFIIRPLLSKSHPSWMARTTFSLNKFILILRL